MSIHIPIPTPPHDATKYLNGDMAWTVPPGGGGGGGAVDSVFGRTGVVTATSGDYTAGQVTNTPAGGISSTTVQAALNELDTEKLAIANFSYTGLSDIPANLTAIANLVSAANKLAYFTGAGTATLTSFTAAGRAICSAADSDAQRALLGVSNVEDIALSVWTGSANITTVGTIATGTWNASTIAGSKLQTQMSITSDGSGLKLSADSASPGNNKVYGTDGSGVKGWKADPAGGVTDGDKGDITVSGSGATWTIDNGVVSLAKMADMATTSLIGRNTSGIGVPEVLSAATAKSMLSLNNVENTALSTWAGSANIVTVGTIATGTWNASTIAGSKLQTQMSVTSDGSGLKLSGDSTTPGNNKVYGTDGSGNKGWQTPAAGGAQSYQLLPVYALFGAL